MYLLIDSVLNSMIYIQNKQAYKFVLEVLEKISEELNIPKSEIVRLMGITRQSYFT